MLVNLMSYWMDPCHSDRIVIITLNIFSHFVFLQYLGYMVATNGDETPVIGKLVIYFYIKYINIIFFHTLKLNDQREQFDGLYE